jgi:hypothetical protein
MYGPNVINSGVSKRSNVAVHIVTTPSIRTQIHRFDYILHFNLVSKKRIFNMFAAASRYLVRRSENVSTRRFAHAVKDQFEEYGKMVFTGKIAEEYLSKHGSSAEILSDPTWVNHSADTVAEAVFDWYVSPWYACGYHCKSLVPEFISSHINCRV